MKISKEVLGTLQMEIVKAALRESSLPVALKEVLTQSLLKEPCLDNLANSSSTFLSKIVVVARHLSHYLDSSETSFPLSVGTQKLHWSCWSMISWQWMKIRYLC